MSNNQLSASVTQLSGGIGTRLNVLCAKRVMWKATKRHRKTRPIKVIQIN